MYIPIVDEIGDDAEDFDEQVKTRFETELVELTEEASSHDFINVVLRYFTWFNILCLLVNISFFCVLLCVLFLNKYLQTMVTQKIDKIN